MTASVENDANRSVQVRAVTRTGLEVLARGFGISIARRDHQRSWSIDDAPQGELQNLKRKMSGLKVDKLFEALAAENITIRDLYRSWTFYDAPQGELQNLKRKKYRLKVDKLFKALAAGDVVRLTREGDVFFESAPSDCAGQEVRDFDEELAERLLSESMDRLAIVAKDISDLVAETAIDLALIEAKRGQIDRAQAENWAVLRELTQEAQ